MIRTALGDITRIPDVEYICNAANGVGPMGSGVAGAIRRAGGAIIQDEAYRVCRQFNPQAGTLYETSAGRLPYRGVIHLVTMKRPGGYTDYNIVRSCLRSLKEFCFMHGVKSVALPALGTGVGRLDPKVVAEIFVQELAPVPSTLFVVTDIDKSFLDHINVLLHGG